MPGTIVSVPCYDRHHPLFRFGTLASLHSRQRTTLQLTSPPNFFVCVTSYDPYHSLLGIIRYKADSTFVR